ncbi:MAG TPA: hypothetical protein VD735_03000, partial [Candidatus Saccharimonadales bacterium]|nr:hypothetical protein [Candidatus Saccharimonadales bacterium]
RFDQLKDYVDAHRPPRIAPEVFAETIVLPDMHNETQVDTFLNQVAELTYLQIEQVRPHWYRTGMMRQPGLCAKTTAIMCHNLGRWGIESEPMYHAFPESHFYVRTTNLPENKDADLTWQQFLPQDDVNFDVPDTLIASSGGLAVAAIVYGVPEHAGRYWDDASPNPTDWREFRSSLLWEVIAPHEQHPEWLGP